MFALVQLESEKTKAHVPGMVSETEHDDTEETAVSHTLTCEYTCACAFIYIKAYISHVQALYNVRAHILCEHLQCTCTCTCMCTCVYYSSFCIDTCTVYTNVIQMYYSCVQGMGATELTLEGVSGVGSEMERIHIAEKNKAMAAKLKVMHMYNVHPSLKMHQVLRLNILYSITGRQ